MKITIHWERVFGLFLAIIVVFIAIICYRILNQSNRYHEPGIGQCDMHEAQKIIDNLVNQIFSFSIKIN